MEWRSSYKLSSQLSVDAPNGGVFKPFEGLYFTDGNSVGITSEGLLNITYNISGLPTGYSINNKTGELVVAGNTNKSYSYSIVVTLTNGTKLDPITGNIYLGYIEPAIGDFAYSDGSFSSIYDSDKTLIGLVFQKEVVTRRTIFELNKAEARAHILEGLKIALDNIDEVISIIRSSKSSEIAKSTLMERFNLSDKQSQAILEMRLRRLTGLERDKIEEEYAEIMKQIEYLKSILASEEKLLSVIKDELSEIKRKYSDDRRTSIEKVMNEIDIEDLIQEEDVVVTLTHSGYIKRIAADTYSAQRRGGRGIQAMSTKEDDFVEHVCITSTHSDVLFFTNRGRVYKLRAYEIPDAGRTAKGTNIINLIQIEQDERIETVLTIGDDVTEGFLFMGTKQGLVKKTHLSEFKNLRKNGLIAINLRDGDELASVFLIKDEPIILATANGMMIKFNSNQITPTSRNTSGVKGINLNKEDYVVAGLPVRNDTDDLAVFISNGNAKRINSKELISQNRGGKGIVCYKAGDSNGQVADIVLVCDEDRVLISGDKSSICISAEELSQVSRTSLGNMVIKNNKIISATKV